MLFLRAFYLLGSMHLPSFFPASYQKINWLFRSLKFLSSCNDLLIYLFVEFIISEHIKVYQKVSIWTFAEFSHYTRTPRKVHFLSVPTINMFMHVLDRKDVRPFLNWVGFLNNTGGAVYDDRQSMVWRSPEELKRVLNFTQTPLLFFFLIFLFFAVFPMTRSAPKLLHI